MGGVEETDSVFYAKLEVMVECEIRSSARYGMLKCTFYLQFGHVTLRGTFRTAALASHGSNDVFEVAGASNFNCQQLGRMA